MQFPLQILVVVRVPFLKLALVQKADGVEQEGMFFKAITNNPRLQPG